jgi:2-polyprenyl-3-methyl-5-hydroxy-6-metoxy-1,4-benzoquinol methylase
LAQAAGREEIRWHGRHAGSRPRTRWRSWRIADFDALTASLPARTAFEVGCGEGQLTLRLLRRGLEVRGCDLDAPIVAKARQLVSEAGQKAELRACSIYDLDPEASAADLVVCCEVMEHLPDPEAALRILARMARPHLLLSVLREPLWRVLNMARGRYLAELGNTPGHIQHWSRSAFIALVGRFAEVAEVRSPLPWTMLLCRVR